MMTINLMNFFQFITISFLNLKSQTNQRKIRQQNGIKNAKFPQMAQKKTKTLKHHESKRRVQHV